MESMPSGTRRSILSGAASTAGAVALPTIIGGAGTAAALTRGLPRAASSDATVAVPFPLTPWRRSAFFYFQKGIKGPRLAGALDPAFPIEEVIHAHQEGTPDPYALISSLYEGYFARVVDPCGGLKQIPAYALRAAIAVPPPPLEGSALLAGELLELYWAAALRDVPFRDYLNNPACEAAAKELHQIGIMRSDSPNDLFQRRNFRQNLGVDYISKFLIAPVVEWPELREQKYKSYESGQDFMTTESSWTEAQSGEVSPGRIVHLRAGADHVNNGRRLATLVYQDYPSQLFTSACLQLHQIRDRVWPRRGPFRQQTRNLPFVMGGLPDVLALMNRCCQISLDTCWLLKWGRFVYPRPEEVSFWAARSSQGEPLHEFRQILSSSVLSTRSLIPESGLLSQAFPDGAPVHPSYPAGHAVIAGAAVTVIKAFVRDDATLPADFAPRIGDATSPRNISGSSVRHELDQLAWNVAFGRTLAGVHFRSDCTSGIFLGEQIAIGFLREIKKEYPFSYNFEVTLLNGSQVTI